VKALWRAEWIAKLSGKGVRVAHPSEGSREFLEARIAWLIERTVHAIANHDFPGARLHSREEHETREQLRLLQAGD